MNGDLILKNMKTILLGFIVIFSGIVFSQKQRCGTDVINLNRIKQNPNLIQLREQQELALQKAISNSSKKRLILTIPVVVHVIYNSDLENISNDQIKSQIDALNYDFNNLNSDSLHPEHPFYSFVGNTTINFQLATIDPLGNATTGITRTKTSKTSWVEDDLANDRMKFKQTGGIENWNPKKYLNIYTVRFDDAVELLGYAYFPEDLALYPQTDGVVIDFRCFGTKGTAGLEGYDAYNRGRTVTHEVGHWLGLNHIWGDKVFETDKVCGDDKVADTPPAESDNSGTPTFPHRPNNRCGSGDYGEMYMNYMDYVHDKSMVMFSKGQVSRISASINTYRSDLIKNAPTDVKVFGLFLKSPNNDTVFNVLNKYVQLSVNVFPVNATNKSVYWSCSPDSIATIDQNGKITILKSGQLSVIVESTDGSQITSALNLTFIPEVKVSTINLRTPNNDTIFKKSTVSFVVSAEVLPSNANNKSINWTCSPDSIATIDQNGKITIHKTGFVTVSAQSMDGSLITASKVISIINDSTTSIFENNQNRFLKIHPNPANNLIYVSTNIDLDGKINIYDVVGKLCYENYFSAKQTEFNLSNLQSGNYIVEIDVAGEISRTKLIKK